MSANKAKPDQAQGISLAEELKRKVGTEWQPETYEIEKGELRRFLKAIEDPNPLWQDEKYAMKSKHGGIVAPPTFLLVIGFENFSEHMFSSAPSGLKNLLNGGFELECYAPIRPGDTVTSVTKVVDAQVREGKKGEMAFMTFETVYHRKQEIVARCRQVAIWH